jgi:hypothetical protein
MIVFGGDTSVHVRPNYDDFKKEIGRAHV